MSGVLARIAGIAIPDGALVTPVLGSTVVDVNETGVTLQDADGAPRRCRPSGGASRTIDASNRGLALPMTGAREEPVVFIEPDTRQYADDPVSLEWGGDTRETQIVVADVRDECLLVFPVPGANAREAFRHPFGYAQ